MDQRVKAAQAADKNNCGQKLETRGVCFNARDAGEKTKADSEKKPGQITEMAIERNRSYAIGVDHLKTQHNARQSGEQGDERAEGDCHLQRTARDKDAPCAFLEIRGHLFGVAVAVQQARQNKGSQKKADRGDDGIDRIILLGA